jgi:hypothetical protein
MQPQILDDWISEADVIAATGASRRNLAEWRSHGIVTGRRRSLGRGAGTTPCFYPPDAIRLIRRLYELQRTVRDADRWLWQLCLEGFSTDVCKWATKRLRRELKLAHGAGADGLAQAASEAANEMPASSDLARSLFDRVRRPEDREAIASYVAANFAGYQQPGNVRTIEEPTFDIMLKAMGIPRSTLPPPEVDFGQLSVPWFCNILETANHDEREQARRDWQAITRLIEVLETTDWSVVGRELEATIEALTKSSPEAPSKRERKAHRQRPLKRPAIVDLFVKGLSDLKCRPHLLALFIAIRRSSPENSAVCTEALALAEALFSHLPKATTEIAPQDLDR